MKKYTYTEDDNSSRVEESWTPYGGTSLAQMDARSRQGVRMDFLHTLCSDMDISLAEISTLIHVSLRTLQRYGDDKMLGMDLSAKLLRLEQLLHHGTRVFGSSFTSWLKESAPIFDQRAPLELLDNPFGIQMVEDSLGQLEHGVFA